MWEKLLEFSVSKTLKPSEQHSWRLLVTRPSKRTIKPSVISRLVKKEIKINKIGRKSLMILECVLSHCILWKTTLKIKRRHSLLNFIYHNSETGAICEIYLSVTLNKEMKKKRKEKQTIGKSNSDRNVP